MISFQHDSERLIRERQSQRTYEKGIIDPATRKTFENAIAEAEQLPFGAPARVSLIAAFEEDQHALKSLGTYGIIQNPAAFLIGVCPSTETGLVSLGFLLEQLVLTCTDLGLGACWLGGSFRRSRFQTQISLDPGEIMPIVISIGFTAGKRNLLERMMRKTVGSEKRLPWEKLFFDQTFDRVLTPEKAAHFQMPLEMVRLAPSASNKQPWRIVAESGRIVHFYKESDITYQKQLKMMKTVDLQLIDMGIAMSHFHLSMKKLGLNGMWKKDDPGIAHSSERIYVATWHQQ